jgi:hypothetical protein
VRAGIIDRRVAVGQAIAGNVTQAPRETAPDKVAGSPLPLADSRMPAMTIVVNQRQRQFR